MTELTPKQFTAIEIQLATAPKIQDDLKAKFGYGENKFFDLDLVEYRMNNNSYLKHTVFKNCGMI